MADKVVLAYSGGLDTSVAIRWLKENYNLDVIALTIDVGNERDFSAVQQKALRVGAVKSLVKDAKELFVEHFIFPALQADAVYEGQYPLATALSRPLMSKLLVDAAGVDALETRLGVGVVGLDPCALAAGGQGLVADGAGDLLEHTGSVQVAVSL